MQHKCFGHSLQTIFNLTSKLNKFVFLFISFKYRIFFYLSPFCVLCTLTHKKQDFLITWLVYQDIYMVVGVVLVHQIGAETFLAHHFSIIIHIFRRTCLFRRHLHRGYLEVMNFWFKTLFLRSLTNISLQIQCYHLSIHLPYQLLS